MVNKHQKEIQELQAQLMEENSAKIRLQMELDSKDSEIEQMQQKLTIFGSETASLSSADNENDEHNSQGLYEIFNDVRVVSNFDSSIFCSFFSRFFRLQVGGMAVDSKQAKHSSSRMEKTVRRCIVEEDNFL